MVSPLAPERKKTTTWQEFIRTHMDVLVATEFFTTEVWTWCGLVTHYTRALIRGRAMSCSFPCPAQLGGPQARFSVAHDWGLLKYYTHIAACEVVCRDLWESDHGDTTLTYNGWSRENTYVEKET
jgi:hypothetical protein